MIQIQHFASTTAEKEHFAKQQQRISCKYQNKFYEKKSAVEQDFTRFRACVIHAVE